MRGVYTWKRRPTSAPQSRSLYLGLAFSSRFRLVAMFFCVSLGRFSRVMRCVMKVPLRCVRVMGRSLGDSVRFPPRIESYMYCGRFCIV